MQFVVGLLVLYLGLTHSWDFAVTHGDLLEFYTNDTKTDTVRLDSHDLGALAYDEVHDIMMYVDKQRNNDAICGYRMYSKVHQCFTKRNGRNIHSLAIDPAKETLFFSDTNERSIRRISLKLDSDFEDHNVITMFLGIPTDIAVDICSGFVYFIRTGMETPLIEKIRVDGTGGEVVITSKSLSLNTTYTLEPHSLTIDQQTQRIYWIEPETSSNSYIYYADLNTKLKQFLGGILYTDEQFTNPSTNTLAVSKTNLYRARWCSDCDIMVSKLNKHAFKGVKSIDMHTQNVTVGIATNYKILEQIQDVDDCKALAWFVRKSYEGWVCVHGEILFGPFCKCTPGYIGERCDKSVCENYCVQGNCSVNDDGLPQCRCNAGYSGKACEVDACLNYCIQGKCSFSDEGLPTCSCNVGYSGQRCEVSACQSYCLNNGVCSLNEEDEPFCECPDGYEGSRCEGVHTVTFSFSNVPTSSAEDSKTNPTLADVLSNVRSNSTNIFVIVDKS